MVSKNKQKFRGGRTERSKINVLTMLLPHEAERGNMEMMDHLVVAKKASKPHEAERGSMEMMDHLVVKK